MSDPSVGSRTRVAMISAVVFFFVVLVGFAIVIPKIMKSFEGPRIELIDATLRETLDPIDDSACIWTVLFDVYSPNRPSGHIWILDADIDVSSGGTALTSNHVSGRIFDSFAGELAYALDPCPDSVQDVDHGRLEVTYRISNQRQPRTANLGF